MRSDSNRRPRRRGFTLVELVVVVMILGILAGVAAPRALSVYAQADASATLTNVNAILNAAQRFNAEHGRLPANTHPPAVSPDFDGYLPTGPFTTPTSFGGTYDWNGPGTSAKNIGVQIRVTGADAVDTRAAYRAMEEADDGSPTTGWITVNSRTIYFELAPKD